MNSKYSILLCNQSLAEYCKLFDSAQYEVEHCKEDEHIVVQASTGTGGCVKIRLS